MLLCGWAPLTWGTTGLVWYFYHHNNGFSTLFLAHRNVVQVARINFFGVMFQVRYWAPHVKSSEIFAAPLPWDDSLRPQDFSTVVFLVRYLATRAIILDSRYQSGREYKLRMDSNFNLKCQMGICIPCQILRFWRGSASRHSPPQNKLLRCTNNIFRSQFLSEVRQSVFEWGGYSQFFTKVLEIRLRVLNFCTSDYGDNMRTYGGSMGAIWGQYSDNSPSGHMLRHGCNSFFWSSWQWLSLKPYTRPKT